MISEEIEYNGNSIIELSEEGYKTDTIVYTGDASSVFDFNGETITGISFSGTMI